MAPLRPPSNPPPPPPSPFPPDMAPPPPPQIRRRLLVPKKQSPRRRLQQLPSDPVPAIVTGPQVAGPTEAVFVPGLADPRTRIDGAGNTEWIDVVATLVNVPPAPSVPPSPLEWAHYNRARKTKDTLTNNFACPLPEFLPKDCLGTAFCQGYPPPVPPLPPLSPSPPLPPPNPPPPPSPQPPSPSPQPPPPSPPSPPPSPRPPPPPPSPPAPPLAPWPKEWLPQKQVDPIQQAVNNAITVFAFFFIASAFGVICVCFSRQNARKNSALINNQNAAKTPASIAMSEHNDAAIAASGSVPKAPAVKDRTAPSAAPKARSDSTKSSNERSTNKASSSTKPKVGGGHDI